MGSQKPYLGAQRSIPRLPSYCRANTFGGGDGGQLTLKSTDSYLHLAVNRVSSEVWWRPCPQAMEGPRGLQRTENLDLLAIILTSPSTGLLTTPWPGTWHCGPQGQGSQPHTDHSDQQPLPHSVPMACVHPVCPGPCHLRSCVI